MCCSVEQWLDRRVYFLAVVHAVPLCAYTRVCVRERQRVRDSELSLSLSVSLSRFRSLYVSVFLFSPSFSLCCSFFLVLFLSFCLTLFATCMHALYAFMKVHVCMYEYSLSVSISLLCRFLFKFVHFLFSRHRWPGGLPKCMHISSVFDGMWEKEREIGSDWKRQK